MFNSLVLRFLFLCENPASLQRLALGAMYISYDNISSVQNVTGQQSMLDLKIMPAVKQHSFKKCKQKYWDAKYKFLLFILGVLVVYRPSIYLTTCQSDTNCRVITSHMTFNNASFFINLCIFEAKTDMLPASLLRLLFPVADLPGRSLLRWSRLWKSWHLLQECRKGYQA